MGNTASEEQQETVANCVAELEALQSTTPVANKDKSGTAEVNHLAKFTLACTLQEFLLLFWEDEAQHVKFLESEINETDINITPFACIEGHSDTVDMQRTVSVCHPLPIQLPWLPLSIQNACVQTVSFDKATGEVRIFERSRVSAIPFCEPVVTASWRLVELGGQLDCEVTLSWECEVFWALQGQIEYYSKLAMSHFYMQWKPHADAIIAARRRLEGGKGGGVGGGAAGGLEAHEGTGPLVSRFWGAAVPEPCPVVTA